MAHIAKFKSNQVRGLLEHNARTDETRPHNHSNEDIDRERTKYNYELCKDGGTAYQRYKDRLAQVHCMKRDNVTVLDSLVVTLPKDVKAGDERKFFEAVYDFACEDYGKQNIVNATVHMDETTPHIHIGFIPVVQGKLRNGTPVEKVRHSSLITKNYLEKMHPRLSDYVENEIGYKVEILNGSTPNVNKTIAELKAERAEERANQAENKANLAEEKAEKAEKRAVEAETALVNLLDNVPSFVAPEKPFYPQRPQEPEAPKQDDYDLCTRHGVNAFNRAEKNYQKDHKIWKDKELPRWERQCDKINQQYKQLYDNAHAQWENKYLTPHNLAKAKAMIEDKGAKLDTIINKASEEKKQFEAYRQELEKGYQQRAQALAERERLLDTREVYVAVKARTIADTIMYNAGYKHDDYFIQNQIDTELNKEVENHER